MSFDMNEITTRLQRIETIKDDAEYAHIEQDALMEDFIRHVAKTAPEPLASMARTVLTCQDIHFSRWYA